jgi:hypothetical protein
MGKARNEFVQDGRLEEIRYEAWRKAAAQENGHTPRLGRSSQMQRELFAGERSEE